MRYVRSLFGDDGSLWRLKAGAARLAILAHSLRNVAMTASLELAIRERAADGLTWEGIETLRQASMICAALARRLERLAADDANTEGP